jgi:DNA-binding transcriptional ArsR family regulator
MADSKWSTSGRTSGASRHGNLGWVHPLWLVPKGTGKIGAMLVGKRQQETSAVDSAAASLPRSRAAAAKAKAKSNAVAALGDTLDTNFFKAIAEPVRQQILLILLQEGRLNVQSVASYLVQDRSVVSRHLAVLEQAGFLRSYRVQRFTEYELDGPAVIEKFERVLGQLRVAAALCCPPPSGGA